MREHRMSKNEIECLMLFESTRNKYFKDIEMPVVFKTKKTDDVEGVHARILYLRNGSAEIWIYYNDPKVLEQRYRWGLIPIIAHELSHIINPVEPDQVMAERLPENMMKVWNEVRESGSIQCSFGEK